MKLTEKRIVILHIILFVICAACMIYSQANYKEFYYRYQHIYLYMFVLVFAKPMFYYSAGFLGAFFLARKAFRDDLNLPYKVLKIVAIVLFLLYVLVTSMWLFGSLFNISLWPWGYAINFTLIVDYYSLVCIPGILFGLVAEKRWKVQ